MRRGEVAGLQWRNVDLDNARLTVTDTLGMVDGKPTWKPRANSDAGDRRIALDPSTCEALRAWWRRQAEERLAAGPAWHEHAEDAHGQTREGTVFTWQDGSLIAPDRWSHWFRKACDDAGLPRIRLHDVRHAYATAALANARGWHEVKVVSERLGHASVGITLDIYAHVLPEADQEVADTLASVILGGAGA